jgi:hypothetical protein
VIIQTDRELQSSLIKTYYKKARRALAFTTAPAIAMSRELDPETLKMMVRGMKSNEHIRTLIIELWGNVGNIFAEDFLSQLPTRKQGTEDYDWDAIFRNYMFERSLKKANSILTTQQEEINRIIDVVVGEADRNGWSIGRTRQEITKQLRRDLTDIQAYHAERIARTEVIGASNTASYEAAARSGLGMRKQWLTSGLKGVRETHAFYESLGAVPMDYSYNLGLKHPGDENGPPEEVINCRCVITYDVD